jgi:hypothetical protein
MSYGIRCPIVYEHIGMYLETIDILEKTLDITITEIVHIERRSSFDQWSEYLDYPGK